MVVPVSESNRRNDVDDRSESSGQTGPVGSLRPQTVADPVQIVVPYSSTVFRNPLPGSSTVIIGTR